MGADDSLDALNRVHAGGLILDRMWASQAWILDPNDGRVCHATKPVGVVPQVRRMFLVVGIAG
jgi:hypothetical protein